MQRSIPILWILVVLLLILNLALLYGLNLARLTVVETLGEVEATLDTLAGEVIVYNIELNQAVPIKADVPLNQSMEIPLNTVIPIDQALTVPIQTGAGEIEIEMPLKVDFPINMSVPVDFNETIKVDTTVQLNTTVPVEIDIAQTPLAAYLQKARLDVAQLRHYLTLQSGELPREETAEALGSRSSSMDRAEGLAGDGLQEQNEGLKSEDIAAPVSADSQVSNSSETTPSVSTAGQSPTDSLAPDSGLSGCDHAYWPLRPGTSWTYNSPDSSYSQSVMDLSDNQVTLSSQYENENIQTGLECTENGFGGSYLGDMRRLSEFGDLSFHNSQGIFLPEVEVMEQIGQSWTQELDVTGTVEARQGDQPVIGQVRHGRASAVYTPTGFETLETPLGPRDALRIEQELEIDLNLDFETHNQTIAATERVHLTTVYWFAKGVGPVKIHWQGGTIQKDYELGDETISQSSSVPELAPEQLVFVCVLSDAEISDCLRIVGIAETDLTTPPENELEIQGFVFAIVDEIADDGTAPESTTTEGLSDLIDEQSSIGADLSGNPSLGLAQDDRGASSALRQYAEAVAKIGDRINEAGESFGESALAYRNNEISLDEFQDKFSSFKPKVQDLIGEINGLSPPAEATAAHQQLANGLDQCDEAVDLMDDWFDNQDSGTKEATILLVASCMDQVSEAGEELKALLAE